jgi:hypothetical protein
MKARKIGNKTKQVNNELDINPKIEIQGIE